MLFAEKHPRALPAGLLAAAAALQRKNHAV